MRNRTLLPFSASRICWTARARASNRAVHPCGWADESAAPIAERLRGERHAKLGSVGKRDQKRLILRFQVSQQRLHGCLDLGDFVPHAAAEIHNEAEGRRRGLM